TQLDTTTNDNDQLDAMKSKLLQQQQLGIYDEFQNFSINIRNQYNLNKLNKKDRFIMKLDINVKANQYYLHKLSKYKQYLDNNTKQSNETLNMNKVKYRPFILETNGGMLRTSKIIIKQIAVIYTTLSGEFIDFIYTKLMRNLIATLMKEN